MKRPASRYSELYRKTVDIGVNTTVVNFVMADIMACTPEACERAGPVNCSGKPILDMKTMTHQNKRLQKVPTIMLALKLTIIRQPGARRAGL
ncbi:hypothetical protein LP414_17320 [Polaromonas sp. P1(28)-13]|nr:hypothetical protein LP414_17320 [Polaromonas sp. P1(28)-13]